MPVAANFRQSEALPPLAFDPYAPGVNKSERLVARTTPAVKSLIERASNIEGCTVSEFLLRRASEAAANVIAQYEVVVLTERERQAFLNALLHPAEPSPKAMAAARRYRGKSTGGMTPDITPHKFGPLGDQHDRAAFSCGDQNLDNYFRNFAGQSVRRQLASVQVASHIETNEVIGYYTLTSSAINAGILPPPLIKKKKYRQGDLIGITLLGRFAINLRYKRKGWGVHMFMDASYNSLQVSKTVASCGILLDTETEEARSFWRSQEFVSLGTREDGKERFFLSMDYIEKLHNPTK